MNLFEINDAITRCVKLESGDGYVDTETGELIDTEALDNLVMERDTKIRNIACWIKNLESDEKALADQIKTFTARKNAAKNKRESLKSYLAAFMAGKKWQNSEVAISWRKSESVEVSNVKELPEEYLKYKDPEPDKVKLKADLKAGAEIDGACLVTKENIQIK
jgi:hypothetical protein